MKRVLSSAAEAEYGRLFINAKEGVPIHTTLQELGHKQPVTGTPLKTDNSTTHGIVHNNVQQKKSRCFDTGFHWIHHRAKQVSTGNQVQTTGRTTSPRTIRLPYIKNRGRRTYMSEHTHNTLYTISLLRGCVNTGIPITVKPEIPRLSGERQNAILLH